MTALYLGDRVRTLIEWGCFRHRRGRLVEMRGERPLVLLDGDVAPVLLFAHEVAADDGSPMPTTGGDE